MSRVTHRRPMGAARLGAAATALALISACGGGGGVDSAPVPAPAPTPAPAGVPAPPPAPAPAPAPIDFDTSEYRRSDGPPFHNAVTAWREGATGQGVTIAIIDSGIDADSPEFAGRIVAGSADVAGSRGIDGEDSHGNSVALVAAAARDGIGVMGIAWQAGIMALRADTPGSCGGADGCSFSDAAIAEGIDRAVAGGARVINISLGGSPPNAAVRNAISRAAGAGLVVVVAAGNEDEGGQGGGVAMPDPDPLATGLRQAGNGNVIIAGSVDQAGVISNFSNRAGGESAWYLAALGEDICCIYENGALKVTTQPNGQQFVTVVSGTSFSAPQIAGAAALLRQAFPNLTATQVVDLLLRTARDAGAQGADTIYGRGILDIARAFAPQGGVSLAGGGQAVSLTETTAVTSAAMGDAIRTASAGAVVLDAYQRAYRMDLAAGARAAQVAPRLGPALAGMTHHVSGASGAMTLAFSVDARERAAALPWSGQLRLGPGEAEGARVLAARVAARLSPRTSVAFAFAQGSDGLAAQARGASGAAFLVAQSPLDDTGFARDGQVSLALRRQAGPWGLTATAESGRAVEGAPARIAEAPIERRRRDAVTRIGIGVDRSWGGLDAAFAASWLGEDRTILGARLHDSLGSGGADSLFLDASAGWRFAEGWRLGAAWRQGYTTARVVGLVAAGSRFASNGWALDVARSSLFAPGDTLALRISQPLRVSSGGVGLMLPVGWDYATLTAEQGVRRLSLAPKGREIAGELAWRGPLWNGAAMASLFYRKEPGHYAAYPDDKGVAVSWRRAF